MAKAKHTYAVRLAVEGGNRVKADLRSVGASGERSIKKIDRASDKGCASDITYYYMAFLMADGTVMTQLKRP